MNKLDEEKEMVRVMKDSGMTLAEVAKELDKSFFWVFSRYNENYAPVKSREEGKKKVFSKKEKRLIKIEELKRKLAELKEEKVKIDEELCYSPHRTLGELEEYRRKRDKGVEIAGVLPEFK